MKYRIGAVLSTALLLTSLGACSATTAPETPPTATPSECRKLDASLQWHAGVRETLQQVIDDEGDCTPSAAVATTRVALFDWDNTISKNDINDATLYWMMRHDRLLAPPKLDWKTTSPYLTDAAAAQLAAACDDAESGKPLQTSSKAKCADEILAVLGGETTSGKNAFDGYDRRRVKATSLWSTSLAAGYTNNELVSFAKQTMEENLKADVGAKQTVGTTEVDGYIRVYPQIKDLIETLKANRIEPWILSGSPEPIVELWADQVGIDADHTVGSHAVLDAEGRRTYRGQGCGGTPVDQTIPYLDGKRCWANQEIFGISGSDAWKVLDPDKRQIIGAGDAVTDLTFLQDATAVRLVINRNQPELMCHAYDNSDGKWLINPMFIEPKPRLDKPYPCSTTGYIASDGKPGPLTRSDGSTIPDQEDTIY